LITGGSSDEGLEVAKALMKRGGWMLHLLDLRIILEEVESATFHDTNVLD